MDMSKMEKFVFLIDIDGTLVPAGANKVKQNILDEITRLKSEGHIFVLSTGRSLFRVFDVEGVDVFDFVACLMGSEIYSFKEKCVIKNPPPLDANEVLKLVEIIEKRGLSWAYKDDKNDISYSADKKFVKKNCALTITKEKFKQDLKNKKVYQILVDQYLNDDEKMQFKNLKFINMPQNYTDVTNINSSKKIAVDYFRKMFKDRKIVAIGDSQNDIEMLTTSDISIAMGNSADEIKQLTTFTTKSLNENGLIYAFQHILAL